jgi:hypothetical protein
MQNLWQKIKPFNRPRISNENTNANKLLLDELWLIIFSLLSTKEKLNITLVCKYFLKLVHTIPPPLGLTKVPTVWALVDVNLSQRKKLRILVDNGIPPEMRANLWLKLVDHALLPPKYRPVLLCDSNYCL